MTKNFIHVCFFGSKKVFISSTPLVWLWASPFQLSMSLVASKNFLILVYGGLGWLCYHGFPHWTSVLIRLRLNESLTLWTANYDGPLVGTWHWCGLVAQWRGRGSGILWSEVRIPSVPVDFYVARFVCIDYLNWKASMVSSWKHQYSRTIGIVVMSCVFQ